MIASVPSTPQESETSQRLESMQQKKFSHIYRLLYSQVEDGQFIIFKGKLWHGTKNLSSKSRHAMIFQYTTPANKIKVPKNNHYPNTAWYTYPPACLLAHGQDNFGYNKLLTISSITTFKSFAKGIFVHLPINLIRKLRRNIDKPYVLF